MHIWSDKAFGPKWLTLAMLSVGLVFLPALILYLGFGINRSWNDFLGEPPAVIAILLLLSYLAFLVYSYARGALFELPYVARDIFVYNKQISIHRYIGAVARYDLGDISSISAYPRSRRWHTFFASKSESFALKMKNGDCWFLRGDSTGETELNALKGALDVT